MKKDSNNTPLAIVGISCRFPKADDLEAYWSNLKNGVDGITDIPESHWKAADYFDADPKAVDKVYAKRGGFLSTFQFDPLAFGFSPKDIEATDTSQLLGLAVASDALDDAGYGRKIEFDRTRTSVILGVTGTLELVIPLGARMGHPIWRKAMKEAGIDDAAVEDAVGRISESYVGWQENSFPGLLGNVVAGRIANRLDLGGTNCVVDAACASSLSALHLAGLELAAGRSDMVVTGGVDTFNDIFMFACFSKTPALSPTGDVRPFDAGGDGTILGEGIGMIVLKRLEDAERDGDKIYAVVRGVGSSSDGKGKAIYEPSAEGQSRALKSAYRLSGVAPDTIELIEAHGTGTKVGDAAEVSALTGVFRGAREDGTWCALGSVKSMIGHTKAAAGVAGLIKAAMSLHNKTLPPTLKVTSPIEKAAPGTTPFYVNTKMRPWLPRKNHPRRVGVSAFGFGGSNFHCVLEEHKSAKACADWGGDVQILAFCGPDKGAIKTALSSFPTEWVELRAAAQKLRAAFRADAPCRLLAVVEKGKTDIPKLLADAGKLLDSDKNEWSTPDGLSFGSGKKTGKLAVLFPGQGSQYTGMLRELACRFPAVLDSLAEADAAFEGPKRLSDLIYPHPTFNAEAGALDEDALRATEIAQPAIGAVSLGALRLLEQFGIRPEAVAGHSYGELTALCAAGRLGADALHQLSGLRGRLMGAGGGDKGSMLAVQAEIETVESLLKEEGLDLVIANKNAPNQCVLSGKTKEIERAAKCLEKKGLRGKRLPVAAAFHSSLVSDARKPFADALKKVSFAPARIPVYANTSGAEYPESSAKSRELLANQLARPVEFVRMVRAMFDDGARTFIEVGPGSRLSGLVKAILKGEPVSALPLDASGGRNSGTADLARTLGLLAARGFAPDLSKWDADFKPANAPKPKFTVPLSGANYVAPKKRRPPTPPRKSSPSLSINQGLTADRGLPRGSVTEPSGEGMPPPIVVEARPASGAAAVPASNPGNVPVESTQRNLEALQSLQEQTAKLHAQFLEGQESALRVIQNLIAQQQGLSPVPTASTVLPAVIAASAPAPVSVPSAGVESVLLEVVSEKTGYPVETLNLDMGLDSDLGIDSIKRVEILAALQEKLPGAPAVKPEHLGSLRTLRQISDFLSEGMGSAPSTAPAAASPAHSNGAVAAPAAVDASRVQSLLLEVVSDKTGYPVESLNLDMGLDSDLGIDSIKRVEILAALQEKMPEAPAVKPEHLGTLRTLRQIADFLSGGAKSEETPRPASAPEASARSSAPTPAPVRTSVKLARRVLKAVKLNGGRKALELEGGAVFWIADDESGLAVRVVERLRKMDFCAELLSYGDWSSLRVPERLSGLVILSPERDADDDYVKNALFLLKRAAPALRAAGKSGGAIFITAARMDGSFGLAGFEKDIDPAVGALAGLAKTAGHEWPEVACKALDIESGFDDLDAAADAVVSEIFLAGPREVGISVSGRRELVLSEAKVPAGKKAPILPDEVVLVTGGARGVTAEAAIGLAKHFKPTLLLLGRSQAPTPEPEWLASLKSESQIKKALVERAGGALAPKRIEERYREIARNREMLSNIARMERAGATVLYRSVDVRDGEAVRALISEVRSSEGPVRGLIHGAGVLADRLIEEKTEEQFDRVYGTKVGGLRALLGALGGSSLKFMALFSSSTGRFGRSGQVDYAMANEVLNKFAQQQSRLRPDCRVVSINWGPWDGGMVSPALRKVFEREGVGLIPPARGAEMLVDELRQPAVPAEIVILGENSSAAAEPKAEEPGELKTIFKRSLSVKDYPFLKDHVIGGYAVLPMAVTVEWLAHAAMHGHPGLSFQGFDGLRILKGVRLAAGEKAEVSVAAGKSRLSGGTVRVPVELRGEGDVVHARAEILLGEGAPQAPGPSAAPKLKPFPGPMSRVYREYLFHGGRLQGLRSIEGCSREGIIAVADGAPAPSKWLRRPLRSRWIADPLALDCSFQMMIVWSFERHNAGSLPCYAERYRQFQAAFPKDGVRIVIRVVKNGRHRALADIDFVDRRGGLVARIEGYECVIDASLNAAFQKRNLAAA